MQNLKNQSVVPNAKRITGQGMTEYIIIVALIAVAAIAAVGFFGSTVKGQFSTLGNALIGETGTDVNPEAVTDQQSASTLKDYNK